MKKLISIVIPVLSIFPIFAQNIVCTNQTKTLSINLNTEQMVYHQIGSPYIPVKPTVISTRYDSNFIKLSYEGNINENKLGLYYTEYVARDTAKTTVACRRYVRIVDSTASIKHNFNFSVSIFPNPVRNQQFNLELTNSVSSKNIEVQIFDMQGRKVFNSYYPSCKNLLISFDDYILEKGLYTLRVKQEDILINKIIGVE